LLPFFHQSSWRALAPYSRIHLDRRIDFSTICFGKVLHLVDAEIHI